MLTQLYMYQKYVFYNNFTFYYKFSQFTGWGFKFVYADYVFVLAGSKNSIEDCLRLDNSF